MKIALCFSGQPRNVEGTYRKFIYPNIIKPNEKHDLDVFVHAWFSQADVGQDYKIAKAAVTQNHKVKNAQTPADVLTKMYEFYDPKKCLLEEQIKFDERDYGFRKAKFIKPEFSLSKNYSMKQVCLLKQQYEKENNIIYDLVFQLRFDLGVTQPIVFEDFDQNKVTVSDKVGSWCTGGRHEAIDVSHAIMGSKLFDAYSRFYDHIEEAFLDSERIFSDENLMEYYLTSIAKLPIEKSNKLHNYSLIRNA